MAITDIYPIKTDPQAPPNAIYVDYTHEIERRSNVLRYEADSGHEIARTKGPIGTAFVLAYIKRPVSEMNVIRDFWTRMRGQLDEFTYQDPLYVDGEGNRRSFTVRFDSDIKFSYVGHGLVTFGVRLKELVGRPLLAGRDPLSPLLTLPGSESIRIGAWTTSGSVVTANEDNAVLTASYSGYGFQLFVAPGSSGTLSIDDNGKTIAQNVNASNTGSGLKQIYPVSAGAVQVAPLDYHTIRLVCSSGVKFSLTQELIKYVV